MRIMWTRHDLLRYAGVPVTGKNTMRKMWSLEELIKFNFLGNYDEATYDQYKNQLNFSTMRKMWSLEMVVKHLYQKVINIPPNRYVQTTSADFDASGNYTGTESYIILPADKPSSYQIINPAVIGVATNGDYLTSCQNMFRDNPSLYLELDYLNTSNVTLMSSMFRETQVTTLDLSNFDTSNVTTMGVMFFNSKATTLDLSSFDTSKVTVTGGMFNNSQATTLDLSSFDTNNVTDMSNMFRETQVTTLDLSSFDTSNVTDTTFMFYVSQATIGYARTQADADNFNSSSGKPATLVFEVI